MVAFREGAPVPQHTNRLIHESSPYLRQHAHNPVDWYAWGAEAFDTARRDRKPILLSVGYSACHWCHVMEHESFEDEATAALMNQHFVNIKVDREERPDVDHIYMNAVQLLTGRGGWPMTVFLTPDGKPFYGGTYFPPDDRHGLPGFKRLLLALADAYRNKPEDVQKNVGQLMDAMKATEVSQSTNQLPDAALLPQAAAALARAYDETHGGIGQAPKFPNEAVFELFLRVHRTSGDVRYLEMVLHTLRAMARGGIYDQLGGGFHRYSVDQRWLVPHFEKMLYDNAQLVPLYLAAFQLTGDAFFATIARETLDYVIREMRDPAGGFYSTQDADSEGVEGKFFVWDVAEVSRLVGEENAEIVCRYWDVTDAGNFEDRNILHVTLEIEQLAKLFRRDAGEVRQLLADSRDKLFAAREQRIKPARDEKVLTAWNALMISAFAKAAEVFDDSNYRRVAVDAVAFIESALARGDRLLSTYKDGVAKLNGYLDDYAFFVAALLDVFEATQNRRYLDRAAALTASMLAHFWDDAAGGFFFTSDDHEALIVRSKPVFDGSIPSGNSVAVRNLLRLYHYTEQREYLDRAEAMLQIFGAQMREQPFGFANMLGALDFYTQQPHEIVVVTPADAGDELLRKIRGTYLPNRTLTVVDPTHSASLPTQFAGKTQRDGKSTVYVCRRMTCSAPATEWSEVEALLDA
ncbi:MAG: thioredoxin domain-containing protein [Deltaproteobacteria bacterium]|nr:thioredoxin domain-containing protein [Deltaproteobacteria bacterium]MBI3389426.1 thioredoxin domain-containing protein [Deltaproteobacteria bacterium]